MQGNTFRTSHPDFPQAVVQDGNGQVLLVGKTGPHMLLSSASRARELVGELIPWREKDDDEQKGLFWNGKQRFSDEALGKIRATSVLVYGEDGAVWQEAQEREAARRRVIEDEQRMKADEEREREREELRVKEENLTLEKARRIEEKRAAREAGQPAAATPSEPASGRRRSGAA